MNMKKKVLVLGMSVLSCTFLVTGCNDSDKKDSNTKTEKSTTEITTEKDKDDKGTPTDGIEHRINNTADDAKDAVKNAAKDAGNAVEDMLDKNDSKKN